MNTGVKRCSYWVLLWTLLCLLRPIAAAGADSADDLDFDHAVAAMDAEDIGGGSRLARHRWELSIAPGIEILKVSEYDNINYDDGLAAEGGLYYQVLRFMQLGVEGGYSFDHEQRNYIVNISGIDVLTDQRLEVARISPCLRLGGWFNTNGKFHWRPYIKGGAGWYEIRQVQSIQFSANQFLASIQTGVITNSYLGANAGGGLEFEVTPQGVIGLQVAYHRVFSRPENLKFIVPSVTFSVLF